MSAGRPAWLDRVLAEVEREQPAAFEIFAPPVDPERRSAVLMLFGPTGDGGTDVVLTARSRDLRAHPGQVSFPGGRIDPTDAGPVEPLQLPSEFTQTTNQRSVSIGLPGPSMASHQPASGLPALIAACASGESPVTISTALSRASLSVPQV